MGENSSDISKRLSEINASNKQLDRKKINENTKEDLSLSLWMGSLKFITQENAASASVTVPIQNNKIDFTLIKNDNKWQIIDMNGDFAINKD